MAKIFKVDIEAKYFLEMGLSRELVLKAIATNGSISIDSLEDNDDLEDVFITISCAVYCHSNDFEQMQEYFEVTDDNIPAEFDKYVLEIAKDNDFWIWE